MVLRREKIEEIDERIFLEKGKKFLIKMLVETIYTWSRIYTTHTMPAKTNSIVTEI
jgi:hypothetical protein